MSRPRSIGLTVLALATAMSLRADVIVLNNGDRISGRIVGETDQAVSINRPTHRNVGRYVDVIERFRIARIERDDTRTASHPAGTADEELPSGSSAASSSGSSDQDAATQRSLALAIARWRAEEYEAAGLELSRLINAATQEQLETMSDEARKRSGLTLAELAADAHFRAAAARRDRAIRLGYVTEYEKTALIPRLIEEYESALLAHVTAEEANVDERVERPRGRGVGQAQTRPAEAKETAEPSSRPAEVAETQPSPLPNVYRIVDWLGRPSEFDAPPGLAQPFAGQVHYAASLIAERVRLDPHVRRDRILRSELLQARYRLLDLAKAVSGRARGVPTAAQREAGLTDLERMRKEYFEQRTRIERREEMMRLREAAKIAEQLQREGQGAATEATDSPVGEQGTRVPAPEKP